MVLGLRSHQPHQGKSRKYYNSSRFEGKKPTIATSDGTPLPIINTGHSNFTHHDSSFHLKDILLVQNATKILSIKRLCSNNNISIEFDSTKVQVKQQGTVKILTEGKQTGGLYALLIKINNQKKEIINVGVFAQVWHQHLGHLHH